MKSKAPAYASYIAALLLFGSNGLIASAISLSSWQIVYLRTGIGSLLLVGVMLLMRKGATIVKNPKQAAFVVLSGVSMGLGWLFLYEAYQRIGIGISSLLYYCGPVLVIAISPIVLKEKLTKAKLCCFAIVLVGVFVINGLGEDPIEPFGIFCGVMAAISYAGLVLFNKKAPKITGLENSALQLFSSFAVVAIFTIIVSGPIVHVPHGQWGYVLFLGLANTGLGCLMYFGVIDKLSAATVVTLGYLEPVSAVLLGVLILAEPMTLIQWVGVVMVVGGALACEMVGIREKHRHQDQ